MRQKQKEEAGREDAYWNPYWQKQENTEMQETA